MRGAIVASLAAISFLFLSSVPAARSPAEDATPEFEKTREVRHVEMHGNQSFSDRKLRGFLRTRGESFWKPWHHSPYRPDFLRLDRVTLQSYYRRRGYLQAQVDSVRTDPVPGSANEVDVNFFLTEGQLSRVSAVVLLRAAPIPEPEVRKVLKQKPLDPVDITRVEADRLAIEDYYANLGYAAVEVPDLRRRPGTPPAPEDRHHRGHEWLGPLVPRNARHAMGQPVVGAQVEILNG